MGDIRTTMETEMRLLGRRSRSNGVTNVEVVNGQGQGKQVS
jgi:hypothetical protein